VDRDDHTDRRELLRSLGRYGLAAGLAAWGGALALRPRQTPPEACSRDQRCGGCPVLRGCGLAPARAHRQARQRG
jgi:hypothetical protein